MKEVLKINPGINKVVFKKYVNQFKREKVAERT
jgi:hypothetical protein